MNVINLSDREFLHFKYLICSWGNIFMLFILITKKTYSLVHMETHDIIPGRFMGRHMSDLFLCAGPSLVFARRHIQSA